jgi:pimeloyl-ACP methyl ester carboxylesterase
MRKPCRWLLFPMLFSGIFLHGQAEIGRARTKKSEARRELPLTAFYETARPLQSAKPGSLIRSEPFDDYDLSADMSAIRILYNSRDSFGRDVAASGVVLIPAGKSPSGGWPVIAWAHGFSGLTRQCAPSLMTNIFDGPILSMYLTLGYAIVAADYAGLGSGSPYAALDIQSNAVDVLYSIPAARAAAPQLGAKWIAMGKSQGAMVVLKLAELPESSDPNFLGSIAISGVADTKDFYENLAQQPPNGILSALAYGIKTVYPEFNLGNMLTARGVVPLARIDSSCTVPDYGDASPEKILQPNWETNQFVQQFLARNDIGKNQAQKPILIIVGGSDSSIPAAMAANVAKRMCQLHDKLLFEEYPELDAASVVGASVRDQINWIQARFAGRAEDSNCK